MNERLRSVGRAQSGGINVMWIGHVTDIDVFMRCMIVVVDDVWVVLLDLLHLSGTRQCSGFYKWGGLIR